MPRIQILICSGTCLLIYSVATAQLLPKKNSSIQQVISYHVYQQKLWSLKQFPKNSVLYQYNSTHVFKTYLPSTESSDLSGLNISFTPLNPKTKPNPHLSVSEKMPLNLQKTLYRYDSMYMEGSPTPRTIHNENFLNRNQFFLPLTKFN
jgi:hypothetical protein